MALQITKLGEFNDPMTGHRIGYSGSVKINRKDFGLTFNPVLDGRIRRRRRDQNPARRRTGRRIQTSRRDHSRLTLRYQPQHPERAFIHQNPTQPHAAIRGPSETRAAEAAAARIEHYADTLRGHRVLHLVGKGNKPATMPVTVPVLRALEACRGQRTSGPLVLRPVSGNPIDRRDLYRMVARIAKAAGIPRHISPHSLRHAAITNALDAGVPLRDAQILTRHADPRTTEHYDRARGNLDRHGVHFLPAYVAGV